MNGRNFYEVTILVTDPDSEKSIAKQVRVEKDILNGVQTGPRQERLENFNRRVVTGVNFALAQMEANLNNDKVVAEIEEQPVTILRECKTHGRVLFRIYGAGLKRDGTPRLQYRCTICKAKQQKEYTERQQALRLRKKSA